MTNKEQKVSAQHLLALVEGKKYKQYKLYIQQIENQVPDAEQAVAQVLSDILVQKKYDRPDLAFNALILYRQLLISASFDYLCQQEYFPQAIHRQLGKICSFNHTEKDIYKRGERYFVQNYKIPAERQTQRYGYNFLLLGLELLKAMSKWYPSDYLDPKKKSIFREMYYKLIDKGVVFPQEKDFNYVKEKDYNRFKQNYDRFKKIQDAVDNEYKQTPAPKETNLIGNVMVNLPGQDDKKKGNTLNYDLKQLTPFMGSQKNMEKIVERNTSALNTKSGEVVKDFNEITKSILKPQNKTSFQPEYRQTDERKKSFLSEDKKQMKNEDYNIKIMKPEEQLIKSSLKDISKTFKQQFHTPSKIPQSQSVYVNLPEQVQNKLNLGANKQYIKKQYNDRYRQQPQLYKQKSPLKMSRTEKPHEYPHHPPGYPHYQTPVKSFSHKSMPKTERSRVHETPVQKKSRSTMWMNTFTPPQIQSRLKIMTLSQMSQQRKQMSMDQIHRFREITDLFYKMRLDESFFQVKTNYFKPLTIAMTSLRQEALKTGEYPGSSNPFYRGGNIEVRLLKQQGHRFTLSLRNTDDAALLIGYKDMGQYRHSNQIEILSWGNKKSINYNPSCSLLKHQYLDIKFTVQVVDHSMKFLPFDLAINGQDCFLMLPVTLLDMSSVHPLYNPNDIEKYSLNGATLVCQPFNIASEQLPTFMGAFRFKSFYPQSIHQFKDRIIGGCSLVIPTDKYLRTEDRSIIILARLVSYPKRTIQLIALHHRRTTQQIEYSQKILQLLYFLMVDP